MSDERMDAFRVRLEDLERRLRKIEESSPPGSVEALKEELRILRERYNDLSQSVSPLVIMQKDISDLPRRIERIESKVESIGKLPEQFQEFKLDFLTFKGKVILLAAVVAPIFTGVVSGFIMFAINRIAGK